MCLPYNTDTVMSVYLCTAKGRSSAPKNWLATWQNQKLATRRWRTIIKRNDRTSTIPYRTHVQPDDCIPSPTPYHMCKQDSRFIRRFAPARLETSVLIVLSTAGCRHHRMPVCGRERHQCSHYYYNRQLATTIIDLRAAQTTEHHNRVSHHVQTVHYCYTSSISISLLRRSRESSSHAKCFSGEAIQPQRTTHPATPPNTGNLRTQSRHSNEHLSQHGRTVKKNGRKNSNWKTHHDRHFQSCTKRVRTMTTNIHRSIERRAWHTPAIVQHTPTTISLRAKKERI